MVKGPCFSNKHKGINLHPELVKVHAVKCVKLIYITAVNNLKVDAIFTPTRFCCENLLFKIKKKTTLNFKNLFFLGKSNQKEIYNIRDCYLTMLKKIYLCTNNRRFSERICFLPIFKYWNVHIHFNHLNRIRFIFFIFYLFIYFFFFEKKNQYSFFIHFF